MGTKMVDRQQFGDGQRSWAKWVRLGLPALALAIGTNAAVLDRVAVTVGKDVITESEVLQEIRLEAFLNLAAPQTDPAARREAAERIIDQTLLRQEIDLEGFAKPQPPAVDQTLQKFKRTHFRTESAYEAALKADGITEGELRDYLLWQITALQFTQQRFRPGTPAPQPAVTAARKRRTPVPAAQEADRQIDQDGKPQTGAPAPNNGSVDQQLDAWLRQARSQARIEFHKEAFE
ncbi:MAG: SurA N-terminal domain-containing protein [Bryobacteraceae bacterium]